MPSFKKPSNLKIISLVMTQVFLFTSLAYTEVPTNIAHLRPELKATTGAFQEGFRRIVAHVQRTPDGLNKHFKILANIDLEEIIKKDFNNDPGTWVMFGDMSAIRLLNTVYAPEIIDILIPQAVQIIERAVARYGGKAGMFGIKGDEIWMALPSRYSKEKVDKIRREIQEEVSQSITGMYWACKVNLMQAEKALDVVSMEYSARDLYNQIRDISYAVLGGEDLVPGLYKTKSGIFMFFRGPDESLLITPELYKENLYRVMDRSVEELNKRLAAIAVTVTTDKEPFGLLSPMVFFGATQKGVDLKASIDRAERILNVAKANAEEGSTDNMFSETMRKYIDLEERSLPPLSEEEQEDAVEIMLGREEISGVDVTPNMLDRTYAAIGERHLRLLAEPWLEPGLAQALVKHTQQPTLVGLLDMRYRVKEGSRFERELDRMFPTDEDKIQKLRGQKDDVFGLGLTLTVAFKYFNDALTGEAAKNLGLKEEGHDIGNKVLKAEAKAILKYAISELKRQNILLFRGPPDNWWFLFLGPSAEDFEENPEYMKSFVDNIAVAMNRALAELGLEVEVGLRMNVVSSNACGRGVVSIIETAKDLARCRSEDSCSVRLTEKGNVVKEYKPDRRPSFIQELALIDAESRKPGIGFLTEKRMEIVRKRREKGILTQNDIDTMSVMHISGWLKGEDLEAYQRLASNDGIEPEEVLENGAAVYNILLPGSNRKVEVCIDYATVELMKGLPGGVTIQIFGNQAMQMILGREGVIAKTGRLDEGDIDCYIENKSEQMVDDAIARMIRQHHPDTELQERITKGTFKYLTEGPFNMNRLVLKLTARGNGRFTIGFGGNMKASDYHDLTGRKIKLIDNANPAKYPPDRAIQGLVYYVRYSMDLAPEAVSFIKDSLNRQPQPIDTFIMSPVYERLRKLFIQAKDPGKAAQVLYELVEDKELWARDIIARALQETDTLDRALASPSFPGEIKKLVLEALPGRVLDVSAALKTHRSGL